MYIERVFAALIIQHAMRMRQILICELSTFNNIFVFSHYFIKGTIFEKHLLNIKCVF